MFRSKIILSLIVAVLLVSVALPQAAPQTASAQTPLPGFASASSSCEQGFYVVEHEGLGRDTGTRVAAAVEGAPARVEAWDSVGTFLGSQEFVIDPYVAGTYSGTIDYSAAAVDTVTFMLYLGGYVQLEGALAEVPWFLADTITVPAICEQIAVPGCDMLIAIPPTAVVGSFVADAVVDWTPGSLVEPYTTIQAGNTAWVLGMDASGAYYKILWGCQYLWVPVGTMGPNYDAVWNGAPLPTGVVA